MDGYTDESRYTIGYTDGGYRHEVKVDAWLTVESVAVALSVKYGRVDMVNNFNGAEGAYRDGVKLWTDAKFSDLYA